MTRIKKCPVCRKPLDKPWHLACAACWSYVPHHQQREVYRLFKTAKGSGEHTAAIRAAYISIREAKSA